MQDKPTIIAQIKKNEKNNTIDFKIIKQKVSTDLYINIIGEKNFQRSWEIICYIYLQVRQKVVYLILKKLLNYLRVVKPLDYKKKVTTIFAQVM